MGDVFTMGVFGIAFLIILPKLINTIKVVPQQTAWVVERLGRYSRTLGSGVHLIYPFLDRVSNKVDLKEESIDVPPQECFTLDEIRVIVDGVIYLQVTDPFKAAYGVVDYRWATVQLAQTTIRSAIGHLSLDGTFEAREQISAKVVSVLKSSAREWGVNIRLYEIKNIRPPESVKMSMEVFMKAEREKKAIIAKSQGDRQARINKSEGYRSELVNKSEGQKQRQINEAEGRASEVIQIADALATSIERISESISVEGGDLAVRLQLFEKYLDAFGNLGVENTKVVLPMDISNWRKIAEGLLGGQKSF